jgi:hypothetical protein
MELIVTFRPEFQPPWTGQPQVTMLALNRLDRRDRTALVEQIASGKSLPDEVVAQIVDRTDGVPLFVEELTKSVLLPPNRRCTSATGAYHGDRAFRTALALHLLRIGPPDPVSRHQCLPVDAGRHFFRRSTSRSSPSSGNTPVSGRRR